MTRIPGRHGLALPVTLLALVVLGITVAAGYFASVQELRTARNSVEQEQVLAAAEGGLVDVVASWRWQSVSALGVGQVIDVPVVQHDGATTRALLTRLSFATFWATAEARPDSGGRLPARRRVGGIVRLHLPDLPLSGALTIRQPPGASGGELGDGLSVTGRDTIPSRWDGCGLSPLTAAGLVTNDLDAWRWEGSACADGTCLEGSPPLLHDPLLGDSASRAAIGETWRVLTSRATLVLAAGTTLAGPAQIGPVEIGGVCDRGAMSNWGDPARSTACGDHVPVIWALGDLHLEGGSGQGVLLVEGDLVLAGGVTFVGLILVRGALHTTEPGGQVIGAIHVLGEPDRRSSLAGGGRFAQSRCALLAALAPHAPAQLDPRSWLEIR